MPLLHLLVAILLQSQAVNEELGYRFTVPAGFVVFPEGRAGHPDAVECWAEENVRPPLDPMVMCVQRMRTQLPRNAMKQAQLPPNTLLRTWPWRALEIQGLRTYAPRPGGSDVALVAQVPLRKEAIQLSFAGNVGYEPRADSLMRATLASLEGDSNWLTATEQSGRLRRSAAAWIVLGVLAFGAWRWRKSRTTA
jgi:hypothetical protein